MRRCLALLLTAAIAGCAGAGGSGAPSVPSRPKPSMGVLTVKILVPTKSSSAKPALRRVLATAESTSGVLFTVYPHGGNPATQSIAVSGDDISANNTTSCTTSGTTRTCSVQIAAPVGTANDLLAQTYDAVIPANGTVPAGAHLLAAGATPNINVTAGSSNTVGITLNPVLASVALSATPAIIRTLVAVPNINVAVYGYDAAGNLILAGSYFDQNGNAVSVSVSPSTNPNASLSPGTSQSVTGSGQSIVYAYNGQANTTGNIVLTAAAPFAATLSIALQAPQTFQLADAALAGTPPPGSGYEGITSMSAGSHNYVLYTTTSNGAMDYVDVGGNGGPGTEISPSASPSPIPAPTMLRGGLANDTTLSAIVSGGPATMSQFQFVAGNPPPPNPQATPNCYPCQTSGGIAYDSTDGSLYFANGTNVYNAQPSYTPNPIPIPSSSPIPGSPLWGGAHYDGSRYVWFSDNQASLGALYMYDTSTTGFVGAWNNIHPPFDVTTDVTMNAWVTDPLDKKVLEYATPLTSGAPPLRTYSTTGTPEYITADNNAVWFSETDSSGRVMLGRIDLTANTLGEVTLTSVTGGSAGPILLLPYAEAFAIVHFGGAGPGELLVVQI